MAVQAERASWTRLFDSDRLCVLGPVALRVDGCEHTLAGMPARIVTLLACTSDRWLTLDGLIDSLWAGSPPDSARAAIHVHLGAVRRWLAEHAPTAGVDRSVAGYHLALGDLHLDYTLMVELAEHGHATLADAPGDAIEILRSAMTLLRGPLSSPVWSPDAIAAASRRLDRCRLGVEEDLVEALLLVGSYANAESIAVRLVDESPFRELRWGQLMRARYLDNRAGEALRTYSTARTLLVEELGSEPGPMLQGLERMVLMHDLDGLRSGSRARPVVTVMRPPPDSILGRDAELRRCVDGLARHRVVAVTGPPGVGKTRLAQAAASVLADADSSVIWVDLQAHSEPVGAIALAIGTRPDSTLQHICELLAGATALIVLDNAEHIAAAVDAMVTELGRALPDVRVLITSRFRPTSCDIHVQLASLPLPQVNDAEDVFENNPAVRLLTRALEDLAPTTVLTRDEILHMCEVSGGLPLALKLAAGELRALGTTARVDLAGTAVSTRLAAMVEATLALRPASSRHAFASLSILAGEFDAACGSAVTGLTDEAFLADVVDLVDCGLVEMVPGPPALYRILPPLRGLGLCDQRSRSTRHGAFDRLADHVVVEARAVGRNLRHGDAAGIEARVGDLVVVAHIVISHLEATADADRALEVAGRLDAALYTLGWWTEKNRLLDRALAIPGGNSAVRARALTLRGRAGILSQFDLDHLRKAEQMATALGDDVLAAYATHVLGIGLWWLGDHEASLAANRAALATFESSGRQIEALETRKFIGLALLQSGHLDAGFREQHEVLTGFERLGIDFHVAHSFAFLGHCHRYVDDEDAAHVDFTAALEVCHRIGNQGTVIHVELGLGDIAADRGDFDTAQRHATAALDLITQTRLRTYEPWAWALATRTALATGEVGRAVGCCHHALAALEFAPGGEAARCALELADVARQLGDDRHAARLIGAAQRQTQPREIPLLPPSDSRRYGLTSDAVECALGTEAARHVTDGRRCSILEAAGDFLTRTRDHLT